MNKKLLALAIGAAAAMPFVAQAAPSIYGKMNVTLDSVENTGTVAVNGYAAASDAWYVNSNASRFGIKGDEETSVLGLKAIYQAEFGIRVDDGTGPISQRNIYVGLKGDFGSFKVGKFDTPLKDAQGKVDQFNDLAADISNVMPGETRANNIMEYTSPKLGNLATVKLAFMPAEGTNVDGVAGNEDSIFDSISASVVIEAGDFYGALAIDQTMSGASSVDTFTSGRADITRLVGGYKTEQIEIGAIYEMAEEIGTGATGEDTAMILSAAFNSGDWKFKGQFGTGEGDVNGAKKTLMALGADYKLGKATTVFGYYSSLKIDNNTPVPNPELTTLALGIEQKF